MRYFGFFKGMPYGKKCKDSFETYRGFQNDMDKASILSYLKTLSLAGIVPMTTHDIFTGEELPQAGVIVDGDFTFPTDFVHYFEVYDIGVPPEYEEHIESVLRMSKEQILQTA